jgi:micrococcal nuclease
MPHYPATIERVIDGDTVIADIDLGLNVRIVQYVRLTGLNAPERYTEAGKAATQYVQERLLIRKVTLEINEKRPREKYGRLLATIWLGDVNFNQALIEAGHAVAYDGGKRV